MGLTGGIAAGKSTASARFAELGAVVIDYDVLARLAVAPGTPGLAAVVAAFAGLDVAGAVGAQGCAVGAPSDSVVEPGRSPERNSVIEPRRGPEGCSVVEHGRSPDRRNHHSLLRPDGTLNRQALADLIFHDPAKRQTLENIIHPEVYRLAKEIEAKSALSNPKAIIIHDVPLLVEANLSKYFPIIMVIITPPAKRIERLIATRGLTAPQAEARISAGAKDYQRVEIADLILDGSGTPAQLRTEVDQCWELLKAAAEIQGN